MTAATSRAKSARIEVRATPEDRALIDRAVVASDSDLTDFVVGNLRVAAQRVLADRDTFTLDDDARREWDRVNDRPSRTLAGLRELMARPSPFAE